MKKKIDVTFFSFMDIMTSALGTLILILISVILTSIKQENKKVILKVKSERKNEAGKMPFFVICEKDKVVLLSTNEKISADDLGNENSPLIAFTNKLNRSKQYIIFAVRPDGIDTFTQARRLVEGLGIDIGYEPVNQQWQIMPVPQNLQME